MGFFAEIFMKKLLIFTDSGHGGMVFKNGKWVYDTGNKKLFKYSDTEIAYEGVINRRVESELLRLWDAEGRAWVDVSSGNLDIPLFSRVTFANSLYHFYKHKYNCLYLSLHSNAGGGTGIEIFTSPGQTLSDQYADICSQKLIEYFPDIVFRKDESDGDIDKEDNFYVLKNTDMPAILVEFLFFDNADDWKLLKDQQTIERYAKTLYSFLKVAEKEIQ